MCEIPLEKLTLFRTGKLFLNKLRIERIDRNGLKKPPFCDLSETKFCRLLKVFLMLFRVVNKLLYT